MAKKPSREWVERTVAYHERIAAGFRRSAERARSARSTIEAAVRLERQAMKAEHDAEYYGRLLRGRRASKR
jgi:hypothetical protein